MSQLQAVVQTPNPGDKVTLFRLDASSVGGLVYYFCQGAFESQGVTFGGVYYTPVDVQFSDFETNGNGALPTPKMKIANANEVIQGMVNAYGDMLGCEVARVRTFRRFLDGQPEADPTAYFGPDKFRVERKTDENPIFIEWELSAAIDQEGRMLPGRPILRDTCMWRYRRWNEQRQAFDYHQGSNACPYTGTVYTDKFGRGVAIYNDDCGHKLSDCQLRYGPGQPVPFGAFPGVARVRLS